MKSLAYLSSPETVTSISKIQIFSYPRLFQIRKEKGRELWKGTKERKKERKKEKKRKKERKKTDRKKRKKERKKERNLISNSTPNIEPFSIILLLFERVDSFTNKP